MRRTLLWVVFTMSLVLLWDKWTVHTGQPSMFGGSPRPAVTGIGPVQKKGPVKGPGSYGNDQKLLGSRLPAEAIVFV